MNRIHLDVVRNKLIHSLNDAILCSHLTPLWDPESLWWKTLDKITSWLTVRCLFLLFKYYWKTKGFGQIFSQEKGKRFWKRALKFMTLIKNHLRNKKRTTATEAGRCLHLLPFSLCTLAVRPCCWNHCISGKEVSLFSSFLDRSLPRKCQHGAHTMAGEMAGWCFMGKQEQC